LLIDIPSSSSKEKRTVDSKLIAEENTIPHVIKEGLFHSNCVISLLSPLIKAGRFPDDLRGPSSPQQNFCCCFAPFPP